MAVDSGYGVPKPKTPKPRKILRKFPGPKGGGVFAQPDPDALKLATGSKVNTQYNFGLLRMFGIGYPQGNLIQEGKRTLSGAEADRRWSQMSHLRDNPAYRVVMGLAQSRTGGVRYVEPTLVRNAPFKDYPIDSTILRNKPRRRTKRK